MFLTRSLRLVCQRSYRFQYFKSQRICLRQISQGQTQSQEKEKERKEEEENEEINKNTDLKRKIQTKIEERKLKYQPGHKLTNDEILSLFTAFHETKPFDEKDDQKFNHLFSQPLLKVFEFERRDFIEGCKQIAQVLGDAVSSNRFRAHINGATHSCPESELLQSVSTPEAYEKIKYLSLPTDMNVIIQNHPLIKLAVSWLGIEKPSYKLISREFFFRRIEQTSIKVLKTADGTEIDAFSQSTKGESGPASGSSSPSPDPSPYRLEMTTCVRYQVQSIYRYDTDDEVKLSDSLTRRETSEWYFLYLQSYLTDYENQEWKITKILDEGEFYTQSL